MLLLGGLPTLGATHHLSIATNSALQQFRILWTMDGTNFVDDGWHQFCI